MNKLMGRRTVRYGVAVCVVVCLLVGIWIYMHPLEHCDRWEKILSSEKQNPTVFLVEEGCSGFNNGATFAIDISLPKGRRETVFKYKDASWNATLKNQTTPSIEWAGPRSLKISIGAVEAVDVKLEKVSDLKISYDIGRVLKN